MPKVISTLLKAQISLAAPLLSNLSLDAQRKLQDTMAALGTRVAANKTMQKMASLPHSQAAWVFPRKGQVSQALLYLHGGGYIMGTLEHAQGFGAVLSLDTQRASLCLGYRLAPEHPFPAALQDAVDAYQLLLTRYRPEDIALVGESAGGGLCFSLALKLREMGLPQPSHLVALSPWVDLAQSLEACRVMGKDPVLSCDALSEAAKSYLAGHDPLDPFVSPLYGDLRDLPPSLIITGGDEILLPESQAMLERLQQAGVAARLHVEDGMWHVYPLYPVPEAKAARALVKNFLGGHV